jgi:hypothetical protein
MQGRQEETRHGTQRNTTEPRPPINQTIKTAVSLWTDAAAQPASHPARTLRQAFPPNPSLRASAPAPPPTARAMHMHMYMHMTMHPSQPPSIASASSVASSVALRSIPPPAHAAMSCAVFRKTETRRAVAPLPHPPLSEAQSRRSPQGYPSRAADLVSTTRHPSLQRYAPTARVSASAYVCACACMQARRRDVSC